MKNAYEFERPGILECAGDVDGVALAVGSKASVGRCVNYLVYAGIDCRFLLRTYSELIQVY